MNARTVAVGLALGGFGGWGSGGPHGGGRGPGGAPGGGAGGWVGGTRPDPEGMGNRPSVLEPEFGRLTIEHAEPLVVFLGDDGVRRELETGSRTEEETAAGVQTTKAKWKEDRLVVVRRGERGKLTETWELDESGDEFFVTVEIEGSGSMPSVSVLRTYIRAESADEPSAASDGGDLFRWALFASAVPVAWLLERSGRRWIESAPPGPAADDDSC